MEHEKIEEDLYPEIMDIFNETIFPSASRILLINDSVQIYEEVFQPHVLEYIKICMEHEDLVCRSGYCYKVSVSCMSAKKDYAVSHLLCAGLYAVLKPVDDFFGHECVLDNTVPAYKKEDEDISDLREISDEDFSDMMKGLQND